MFSNIFESFGLAEDFRTALKVIEDKNPTAKTQGKNECCKSGVCCWRRPGSLSPSDVPIIAKHFNLTEQEFFQKYLVVDDIKGMLTVLPRRKHQEEYAGGFIPWRETYSISTPCVFLEEGSNNCSIHDVKPTACKKFKCWEPSDESQVDQWTEEQIMKLGWNGSRDEWEYEDYD